MTPVWYAAKVNSPRLWLAWLLLCLLALASPAQALNGLKLPMSAFSPGSKRACTAKSFRVDCGINRVDPTGLEDIMVGAGRGDFALNKGPYVEKAASKNYSIDALETYSKREVFSGLFSPPFAPKFFLYLGHNYENDDGLHLLDGSMKLGELFAAYGPQLQPEITAMLGCNTSLHVSLPGEGGRCFVGFSAVVNGDAINIFSKAFFDAIVDGSDVTNATDIGISAVARSPILQAEHSLSPNKIGSASNLARDLRATIEIHGNPNLKL